MSSTTSPNASACRWRTPTIGPAVLSGPRRRADRPGRRATPPRSRATARRLFLPDPDGVDAYPIVTFSWLLLQDRYGDPQKTAALKKFIAWGLTDGQGLSRELGYIPLPTEVASLSLAALDRLE